MKSTWQMSFIEAAWEVFFYTMIFLVWFATIICSLTVNAAAGNERMLMLWGEWTWIVKWQMNADCLIVFVPVVNKWGGLKEEDFLSLLVVTWRSFTELIKVIWIRRKAAVELIRRYSITKHQRTGKVISRAYKAKRSLSGWKSLTCAHLKQMHSFLFYINFYFILN